MNALEIIALQRESADLQRSLDLMRCQLFAARTALQTLRTDATQLDIQIASLNSDLTELTRTISNIKCAKDG